VEHDALASLSHPYRRRREALLHPCARRSSPAAGGGPRRMSVSPSMSSGVQ